MPSSPLVRPREAARAVTPLELLFDLVYVFAVSQLSRGLIEHVDARGISQTVVLTLAAMYAWFMTVWTSNWLDVERRPVQLMLLALMFASLLMSTSIAGIFASGDARLAIWAVAVAVTYGGVIAGHPLPGRRSPFSSDSQIYAEHLLERFRLFFLIALGETVLTIGNAFANVSLDAERMAVLVAAFIGTVSLWWCYFHRAEQAGREATTTVADPSRIVAVGNYALIAMVIGIVGIAVGDELALVDPQGPTGGAAAAIVFGGPAIFLLAQLGFMRHASGWLPLARILACAALVLLAIVHGQLFADT